MKYSSTSLTQYTVFNGSTVIVCKINNVRYCNSCISVFDKLIWHTIGPKSFLFGTAQFSLWVSGAVDYDYIITNSINSLLIGSRYIPNGAHCWANLAHASKSIETLIYINLILLMPSNIWFLQWMVSYSHYQLIGISNRHH